MPRLHCAAALSFIVAGIVDVTGAQAASLRVGDTVQIVHDVEGRQSGDKAWGSKAEGDYVYENEFIRTEVESQARIVLVDRTGLSVGPITTIRIDRVVYSPDQSIKGIVVSAGTGTVRWTSGDSSSYLIRTPTADVTPIGTVFDLFVDSQRTFVILRQGRVKVCTNNLQPTCKILAQPGEMMLATAEELQGPGRGGLEPVDFANRCLSATGQNCVMNLTYNPPPAPQREPPVSKTRRADVQPSRQRVVEEKPRRPGVVEQQPGRQHVVEENVAAAALGAFAFLPLLGSSGHGWGHAGYGGRYPRPPTSATSMPPRAVPSSVIARPVTHSGTVK
jgi:Tfp pilus assembly protein FimT